MKILGITGHLPKTLSRKIHLFNIISRYQLLRKQNFYRNTFGFFRSTPRMVDLGIPHSCPAFLITRRRFLLNLFSIPMITSELTLAFLQICRKWFCLTDGLSKWYNSIKNLANIFFSWRTCAAMCTSVSQKQQYYGTTHAGMSPSSAIKWNLELF